jgi:hypothetical protein
MFKVKRPRLINLSEDIVRRYSLRRLSEVFGVPEESLSLDARFGQELLSGPVHFLKRNQSDIIYDDMLDVMDRKMYKEFLQGKVVILTARDYCDHMVRCSRVKPTAVVDVLRMPVVVLNQQA